MKNIIKITALILSVLMLSLCAVSCAKEEERVPPKLSEIDLSKLDDISNVTESETPTDYVIIDITDYGKIVVRLFPDVAPETVANFKKLVSEKFYDGLIFHRVIEDFMIQGGDPEGTGMGGSDENVKGEFSANGFENNLSHLRGVISMARSQEMDSASSQFFICQVTYPSLNGQYAAFGYVVHGIEIVDEIAAVNTNANDKPLEDVVITSIRFANVAQ